MSEVKSCSYTTFSQWQPSTRLIVASALTWFVLSLLATMHLTGLCSLSPATSIIISGALVSGVVTIILLIKKYCMQPALSQEDPQETVRKVWNARFPVQDAIPRESEPLSQSTPSSDKPAQPLQKKRVRHKAAKNQESDSIYPVFPEVMPQSFSIFPNQPPEEESKTLYNLTQLPQKKRVHHQALIQEDPRETVREAWNTRFPAQDVIPRESEPLSQSTLASDKPAQPLQKKRVRHPLPSLNKTAHTEPKNKELSPNSLQLACLDFQSNNPPSFKKIIDLVQFSIKHEQFSLLLYQETSGKPLDILLNHLQERIDNDSTTQEHFMQCLELETLLRSCLSILRPVYKKNGDLEHHFLDIQQRARHSLSKASQFLSHDKYIHLDYGLPPIKSSLSHLILMDQDIRNRGEGGTSEYEGSKLSLDYLINFLMSHNSCYFVDQIVYPIAANLSYFLKEIRPMIQSELLMLIGRWGINHPTTIDYAGEIAEKVLARADQNHDDPSTTGVDMPLALGWTKHSIAVGIRKREKDDYVLTIVNGGNGVPFHPHNESTTPTYNPLFILSGTREQVKSALSQFFLLNASSYIKANKVRAKEFYSILENNKLKKQIYLEQPQLRCQILGNCGIHNMRELIFFNIQRREAHAAEQRQLHISKEFPSSIANKFQDFIYRTGNLNIDNNRSFLPEEASTNHIKKTLRPGIKADIL